MKRYAVIAGLLVALAYKMLEAAPPVPAPDPRLAEQLMALEARVQALERRKARAGARAPSAATAPLPPSLEPAVIAAQAPKVGQIDPALGHCARVILNTHARLTSTLLWSEEAGAEIIATLPALTEVEILGGDVLTWQDYPDEHAVFVEVARSPEEPRLDRLRGYIELSKFPHRDCNIGAQYDR
jgi:hypothetical protein